MKELRYVNRTLRWLAGGVSGRSGNDHIRTKRCVFSSPKSCHSFSFDFWSIPIVNVIKLDARYWKTASDFYNALLRKLGAPGWHGQSVAALVDSMIVGDINQVELPLRIEVTGLDRASEAAFDELISAFTALGHYGAVGQITSDSASLEIDDGVSPFPFTGSDN